MNKELVANMVSFEEDDIMAVFAFCADEGQSAEYVMLQYPLQTDEQDRRLAWTVCTSNEMIKHSGATEVSSKYEGVVIASKSI